MDAAKKGDVQMLKAIIEKFGKKNSKTMSKKIGVNVNDTDNKGSTALQEAALAG